MNYSARGCMYCEGECNKECLTKEETVKEPTMIDDWLDKHGDPEIYKKVEKQLELEEAAINFYREFPSNPLDKPEWNYNRDVDCFKKRKAFINGAKWQQEQNNTSKVNRVEVIQHSPPHNGRAYTNYNAKDVEIQFQDDGKTLKIFLI
jgi:hypothetical protein